MGTTSCRSGKVCGAAAGNRSITIGAKIPPRKACRWALAAEIAFNQRKNGFQSRRKTPLNGMNIGRRLSDNRHRIQDEQAVNTKHELKANTSYQSLDLNGSDVEELPDGISVQFRLNLANCKRLTKLPEHLSVGSLNISGCTSLERLPDGLAASFLDMSGCGQIESWPKTGSLAAGRLTARDCVGMTELPSWLGRLSQLDLAGCAAVQRLPDWLEVSSWIDVAGTGITSLPHSLDGVGLRWRGVRIDERIAFRPTEISAAEVLGEKNAELRRVKMERMGYDRFLDDANSEILDTDTDPGGERKLLRVELDDDEPLICVSVVCPSTKRLYLIRVPPDTKTCGAAIAWTAGFDDPNDYAPLIET